MKGNNCSDNGDKGKRIRERLRDLLSLVWHARKIEEDSEVIVRLLREQSTDSRHYTLTADLAVNLGIVRELIGDSDDVQIREFSIGSLQRNAAIIFIEDMVNQKFIADNITRLTGYDINQSLLPDAEHLTDYIKSVLLTASSLSESDNLDQAVKRLVAGDALLLVDGIVSAIIIAVRKLEVRSIEEPQTESDVRGPKDGFTEDIRINITLLRRRIKNPNLVVKKLNIGVRSDTSVAVIYYRGITNMKLICEVERRLSRVNVDMPNGSAGLQGLIEDHPYSPFPTIMATERPDKIASGLLEGKVAIIIDGTPFCLVAPATFADFFQAGDDYYEKWLPAAIIRMTRFITAFFAMITPALYVAMTTFHPGLIPTPLTMSIGAARMGVPFPAFIEALLMEIMLEVMQEAGVRLPKTIGPAVSIVGGLVIGEAAVRANLVSSSMIIITAFTAIASFNIANYRMNLPLRLFRVPLMALGAAFGVLGVIWGLLAIVIHLSRLESFGEPYLAPFIPRNLSHITDLKDTFVVLPPAAAKLRPRYLEPQDIVREGDDLQRDER